MANNDRNIFIAGDANVIVAKGRVAKSLWPTSIDGVLDASFQYDLGFITEDGEALSRSITTEAISMHQQSNVRTVVTGGEQTFSFTAGEAREIVKDLFFGTDKVLGYRDVKADASKVITFVYDAWDTQEGFEKQLRLVGYGLITPNGDLSLTRSAEAGFALTINIMGDLREISTDEYEDEVPEVQE